MASLVIERLIISLIDNIGGAAAEALLGKLTSFPGNDKDATDYFASIKVTSIEQLRSTENQLVDCLKLLMDKGMNDEYDMVDNVNKKVRQMQKEMDRSTNTTKVSGEFPLEVFRALSVIFLTVQYESSMLIFNSNQIENAIYDGKDIRNMLRELRTQIQDLEGTYGLKNQAMGDPKMAQEIYNSLKSSRKQWMEFVEESSKSSLSAMNKIVSGVVIKKPKLFGKRSYNKNLSELIWHYATFNNLDKVELPQLALGIKTENENAEFGDEDLEEAIQFLIDNNRAYSINIEDNIKVVEFKKSDKTLICASCNKSGGSYEEFRLCQNANKHVCSDCITFFGKCKVCGLKYKENHPLVV